MRESTSYVDFALTTGGEKPRTHTIDNNASGGNYHDRPTSDGLRVEKSANRLPTQAPDHDQQKHSVEQSGEDRRTAESIGEPGGWRALDEDAGDPRDHESQHVAEIVASVRQEGNRVSEEAEHNFQHHETDIERDTGDEGFAETCGRMAMVMPGVVVAMMMVVI